MAKPSPRESLKEPVILRWSPSIVMFVMPSESNMKNHWLRCRIHFENKSAYTLVSREAWGSWQGLVITCRSHQLWPCAKIWSMTGNTPAKVYFWGRWCDVMREAWGSGQRITGLSYYLLWDAKETVCSGTQGSCRCFCCFLEMGKIVTVLHGCREDF